MPPACRRPHKTKRVLWGPRGGRQKENLACRGAQKEVVACCEAKMPPTCGISTTTITPPICGVIKLTKDVFGASRQKLFMSASENGKACFRAEQQGAHNLNAGGLEFAYSNGDANIFSIIPRKYSSVRAVEC